MPSLRLRADRRSSGRPAFTIVEILAVIGIIAVLTGLLLVGLQSAQRAALRTKDRNSLRQIYIAWDTYASANDGRMIPGWLSEDVQDNWRARYRDFDGETLDASDAAGYAWRLMPYLDNQTDPFINYRDDQREINNALRGADYAGHEEAVATFGREPGFGYNAYYLGGWYDDPTRPRIPRYATAEWEKEGSDGTTRTVRGGVVIQGRDQIRRPSEVIAFAPSTRRTPGEYQYETAFIPGAPWVSPPRRDERTIWGPFTGQLSSVDGGGGAGVAVAGGGSLSVFVEDAVPLRRDGRLALVLHCDSSVSEEALGGLLDMRKWIDVASESNARPNEFSHTE
mgnify:CR=1 FL=1